MAKLIANTFKGITSKLGIANQPGLGSDCANVIIERGEICNRPAVRQALDVQDFPKRINVGIHCTGPETLLLYYQPTGDIFFFRNANFTEGRRRFVAGNAGVFGNYPGFTLKDKDLPNASAEVRGKLTRGNWVTAGEYIFFITVTSTIEGTRYNWPRMPSFRADAVDFNEVERPRQHFIGVRPPREIHATVDGAPNILTDPTYDFACTWVRLGERPITSQAETSELSTYDVESKAVLVTDSSGDSPISVNGGEVSFRVYLPTDLANMAHSDTGFRIGLYMKKASQSLFHFVKYSKPIGTGNPLQIDTGYFNYTYAQMTIGASADDTPTPSTVKFAEFVDRDIPPPGYHATVYKSRMYYCPWVGKADVLPDYRINDIHYSQINSGVGNEYHLVEGLQPVGDDCEPLTGVIEYMGQLIIFKQNVTYVLTDDILTGELRILFNDRGCVNVKGGHGYIVADGVLYFVSEHGVYAWGGGTAAPIEISEPIRERLNDILVVYGFDRYSVCRLQFDPKYNHLYLMFPKINDFDPEIETLIFHPTEGGAWTVHSIEYGPEGDIKRQDSQFILLPDSTRLLIVDDVFFELSSITDTSIQTERYLQFAHWVDSFLDFDEPNRLKHWKMLKIGHASVDTLTVSLVKDTSLSLFGGSTVLSDPNQRVYLGRHVNSAAIRFETTKLNDLFRIHNYDVEVHLRGRR